MDNVNLSPESYHVFPWCAVCTVVDTVRPLSTVIIQVEDAAKFAFANVKITAAFAVPLWKGAAVNVVVPHPLTDGADGATIVNPGSVTLTWSATLSSRLAVNVYTILVVDKANGFVI